MDLDRADHRFYLVADALYAVILKPQQHVRLRDEEYAFSCQNEGASLQSILELIAIRQTSYTLFEVKRNIRKAGDNVFVCSELNCMHVGMVLNRYRTVYVARTFDYFISHR